MAGKEALNAEALLDVINNDGAGLEDEDEAAAFEAGFTDADDGSDPTAAARAAEAEEREEDGDGKGEGAGSGDGEAAAAAGEKPPGGAAAGDAGRRETSDALEQRLRRLEGRFGQVNDQLTRLLESGARAAATETSRAGGDAPSTQAIRAAAAAGRKSEKWKALEEEFPEWAEATAERLDEQTAELGQVAQSLRAEIGATKASMKDMRDMSRVDAAFPRRDWEEDIKTPEFATWLRGQNPDVQDLAASDRALDAIKLLDLYYEQAETRGNGRETEQDSGSNDDPRRRLQGAAPATTGGSRRVRATPSEEEEFLAGFNGN